MIVENGYIAEKVRLANESILGKVNFDLDVTPITCSVRNTSRFLVWEPAHREDLRFDITHVGDKALPDGLTIVTDMYTAPTMYCARELLRRNKYDLFINGCGPDANWDIAFDYMLDSLKVYLPNKRKLPLSTAMDEKMIGSLLLLLNDTKLIK